MESSRPLTAEEEALKRNTDCVYFLASPLTCKKGNECEYRHSEGARVNPRDCWYWLNGNCLNPKCLFRHPPLDGLFSIPGTSSRPAPPSSQIVESTQIPTAHTPGAYNPSKQSVPCYYFQKGQCLKGDRCPFMHGPHPADNHVTQQVAKVSTSLTETPQTLSWGLKECTTRPNIPKLSVKKPVEAPHSSAKSANKAESAPSNGLPLKKSLSLYPAAYELPRSQATIAPVSSNSTPSRPPHRQPQLVEEHHQNGREVDEFLGESSPGFDVLVDDDIGDSDYYHNEEDFRNASVHGRRNPNEPANDFDCHRPDYEPVASFERDQYNGKDEYNRYGGVHNRYGQDQCRSSSERILDRQSMPESRVRHREVSPDEISGSDLRHRLLKQRRLNGSRSVVSSDRRGEAYRRDDRYVVDRYHHGPSSGRDQQRFPPGSTISSRLQGRITLPRRSSPDRPFELRTERDRDKGRHRGRVSPVRPINYQGRPHDRIMRRPNEDFTPDGRSFGGQPNRTDGDPLNFAGPKSLAELKGAKVSGSSQDQSPKAPLAAGYQASEGSLSFEGPKPLSAILKRERETSSGNGSVSSSGDENNQRDAGGVVSASATAAASDMQSLYSPEAVKESNYTVSGAEEDKVKTVEEEEEEQGHIPTEGEEFLYDGQSSARGDAQDEVEDGMIVDAMEDQDLENFDLRDEEFDYEAIEGGDIKTEDDENAYPEDEEDLDDEDDFAKKVGVMFS